MSKSYRSAILAETTPAAAGTVVGASAPGMDRFDAYAVYATIAGATGGTLDVYLQCSFDDGVTWYDFAHFPQITAAAAATTYAFMSGLETPAASGATVVGKGTVSVPNVQLSADVYVRGPIGNLVRAVYVAGAGTSAGGTLSVDLVGFTSL